MLRDVDATPFCHALMAHGLTEEEAKGAAWMLLKIAGDPPVLPRTVSCAFGTRVATVTGDLDSAGRLILTHVTSP